MKVRLVLPALLVVCASLVLIDSAPLAQTQRDRPSRRVTNPVRTQSQVPVPTPTSSTPSASDPTLVSTAEEQDETPARTRRTTGRTRRNATSDADAEGQTPGEQERLRRTVNRLSEQVNRLSEDMAQMKGDQRVLVDLERLTRAEQRAESLRAQLRDVTDKEFTLQERAAQLQDELDPDAIARRAALVGSLRPDEVRDQIRRGLERERERVQRQLELLGTSRTRLESAIASADAEVERIRQRIEAAEREQPGSTTGTGTGTTNAITPATAAPSPTPTPAEPPKE